MDFSKKLKLRLCLAVLYILLGITSIIVYAFNLGEDTVLLTFGTAFTAMGVLRVIRYFKITRNPESVRLRKTEESDERSIAIVRRAKAVAFGVYTFGAAILVIVLEFSGKSSLASAIALNICAIVFIYWLSYIILQKRS